MFDFLKSKSENDNEDNPVSSVHGDEQSKFAPNTGITYKKNLINRYKSEHEQLLGLYGKVIEFYQAEKYEEASQKLYEMRVALPAHILDEELNFYIYLKHCYTLEKETQDRMMKQRKDIKIIGLNAISFLKKYSKMGSAISSDPNFVNEFEELGEILTRRISLEEQELYPLYCPPD